MSFAIEDQVIVALRRITRAIDLRSRGLLQAFGLTAPQLAALRELGRHQPVSMSELARALHISQATLTGVLDRLEKRGLARRSRDGIDRRSVRVELTSEGESLLELAPSLLQDCFRKEFFKLQDWEQTQMLSTLQRVASLMEQGELPPVRRSDRAQATGAAASATPVSGLATPLDAADGLAPII